MRLNYNALPALIALAILVVVFAAISRHHTRERVRLWLTGWVLVLVRAAVQFAHVTPVNSHFDQMIGLCSLELASIVFLISVAPQATTLGRQLLLAAVLGIPSLIYTNGMIWGVRDPDFYYALLGTGAVMTLSVLWMWHRKFTVYVGCVAASVVAATLVVALSIHGGNEEYGMHLMLAALNFCTAGMFWYGLRRTSAGVLATVFGFIAWGISFPIAILLSKYSPAVNLDIEIWDVPKYVVAIGMIVTLLEEQILESEHLAYHDALTGLPNRRLLQDRLLQALAHASRSGRRVAVLLLDLDDFKWVNDTFGHRIGDSVLQEVAARLSARLRAADTIARSGGDEFTVISEVTDPQGARTLVWALETALVLPLRIEKKTVRLAVSVGYALFPDDATDPADLCSLADKAMYACKQGRSLRSSVDPAS